MAKTRGTGLLMAWVDVDPAHEDAFNRWYNEEHIGRLLAVPGFLSAARYAALRGGPKYLEAFEFENTSVPDSPEWARARTGNPWNARMRPHVRLDERSPAVFRRIYPA